METTVITSKSYITRLNFEFEGQPRIAYRIAGTRISLDSIVVAYQNGFSAEAIATECFPSLTLEQVKGALAFYQAYPAEVEAYLHAADAEFEALRRTHNDVEFSRKIAEARRQLLVAQP